MPSVVADGPGAQPPGPLLHRTSYEACRWCGVGPAVASAHPVDKPVNDQQGDEQRDYQGSFRHVSSFRSRWASEGRRG